MKKLEEQNNLFIYKNKDGNIVVDAIYKNETYEYLKKLPIFQSVDGWIVSCEYHILKPNKEIYIKLFQTLNLNPEECFFIDDKEENIKTAKTLGMKGFTLDIKNHGLDKLMESLKENNINFIS